MNFKELREKVEKKKDYFNEKTRLQNLALIDMQKAKDELKSYYNSYLQNVKIGDILTFEKDNKQIELKLISNIYGNFDLLTINDEYASFLKLSKNVCLCLNFGTVSKLIKYFEKEYEYYLIETI